MQSLGGKEVHRLSSWNGTLVVLSWVFIVAGYDFQRHRTVIAAMVGWGGSLVVGTPAWICVLLVTKPLAPVVDMDLLKRYIQDGHWRRWTLSEAVTRVGPTVARHSVGFLCAVAVRSILQPHFEAAVMLKVRSSVVWTVCNRSRLVAVPDSVDGLIRRAAVPTTHRERTAISSESGVV